MKRNISSPLILVTLIAFHLFLTSCNNDDANNSSLQQKEKDKEMLNKELDTINKEKNNTQNVSEKNSINKESSLKHLKALQGKYAFEVNLLEDKELKKRMKAIMPNDRYDFLYERWAVETPIEMKNDVFVSEACERHNCPNTNFIILVDFKKDILYVGIREEFKVEYYSEDGTQNDKVTKWGNDY